MILSTAALATMAIVTQNAAPLRASPRDAATHQAVLWQGEMLEVRGERLDYLQVYDHRRERAGYIRRAQVRTTSLKADEAPGLLSVMRFLKDTPGAEALGIGYATAYLQAAPSADITAEPLDALATMAERLATRASTGAGQSAPATVSAHLEVAARLGVAMKTYERDGAMRICYDGDMYRRVLSMRAAEPDQKARAALGLTRHDCVDPALRPTERLQHDQWRAQVLDMVPAAGVDPLLANRVRLRRAGVWAALAHAQAHRAEDAKPAATRAIEALAGVDKAQLTDDDQADYTEAALRVGASRWALEAPIITPNPGLRITTVPGAPGETCVLLLDARHDAKAPLARRCTYGQVWAASASAHPAGTALALAVQPLATWRELWVFRKPVAGATEWTVDVLPPGTAQPGVGYIEFAGWVPGAEPRLLAAREVRAEGRQQRRFEVLRLDTLAIDKEAGTPDLLTAFKRWQDPAWKRATVSLR